MSLSKCFIDREDEVRMFVTNWGDWIAEIRWDKVQIAWACRWQVKEKGGGTGGPQVLVLLRWSLWFSVAMQEFPRCFCPLYGPALFLTCNTACTYTYIPFRWLYIFDLGLQSILYYYLQLWSLDLSLITQVAWPELTSSTHGQGQQRKSISPEMLLLEFPLTCYCLLRTTWETERELMARTCRGLYEVLDPYLYRHNARQSRSSALLWAADHRQEATARDRKSVV